MTARIAPRLSALLSDLGIGHAEEAEPAPRHLPSDDPNAIGPTAPVNLVLRVDSVDDAALAAAGLHLLRGSGVARTGAASPASVPAVADVPGVVEVDLADQGAPDLNSSVPATRADHARTGALGLSGAGVVVGVVDSGIDIFHHAFRKPDGSTRLLGLLDTTAPYTITAGGVPTGGTFTLGWVPPAGRPGAGTQQTTPALPFDATVQQVLAAISTIGAVEPGDVLATGGPLPGSPVVVAFAGRYLRKDVKPLVVAASTITPAAASILVERGREYTPDQINTALANPAAPFGSWDEDGHGTHVMGIAAGDGSQAGNCQGSDYYVGVAPAADLVAVKTTFADAETIRGVEFVFDRATALGKAAVVNLSLGSDSGAHDGSGTDELRYDQLLTTTPAGRAIIKSAGNSGARYDHSADPATQPRSGGGIHSFKTLAPNSTQTMSVVIRPSDRQDDWFELWYAGAGRVSLQLAEPGGAATGTVVPDAAAYTTPLAGHGLRITSATNATSTGRHRIFVRLSPPAGGAVTPGTWVITLTETAGQATDVDCWIRTDRTDPHPRFADADQDRTRTLSTPGTARNVIAVANYDHRTSELAESSSRGPTADVRPAGETKPDVAAPGTGITSAKSAARNTGICCDCCTDFYVAMSGTSMAAPHVTGIVALLFQRNRTLTFDQVRAHLRASADPPDPITAPTLPNADWGAGIVNAEVAAAAVPLLVAATDSPTALPTFDAPSGVPAVVPAAAAQARPGAPAAARLAELRAAVLAVPAGQLAAALVSTHVDEVLRLINTRRRVTVAWHRMGGPDLLTSVLSTPPGDPVAVPATVRGRPVGEGLAALLDELEMEGSLPLRSDVARFRALLLSLPGMPLAELAHLDVAG